MFNFPIYISIYAAHLYDSVVLYAKALDTMIRDKQSRNETYDINQLARDGNFYLIVFVLTTHRLAYLCYQCFASLDMKLAPDVEV